MNSTNKLQNYSIQLYLSPNLQYLTLVYAQLDIFKNKTNNYKNYTVDREPNK